MKHILGSYQIEHTLSAIFVDNIDGAQFRKYRD